jgi:hypothetical protein
MTSTSVAHPPQQAYREDDRHADGDRCADEDSSCCRRDHGGWVTTPAIERTRELLLQ